MDLKGFLTYRVRSGYEDSLACVCMYVCMYVCIYVSTKFLSYLFISSIRYYNKFRENAKVLRDTMHMYKHGQIPMKSWYKTRKNSYLSHKHTHTLMDNTCHTQMNTYVMYTLPDEKSNYITCTQSYFSWGQQSVIWYYDVITDKVQYLVDIRVLLITHQL